MPLNDEQLHAAICDTPLAICSAHGPEYLAEIAKVVIAAHDAGLIVYRDEIETKVAEFLHRRLFYPDAESSPTTEG